MNEDSGIYAKNELTGTRIGKNNFSYYMASAELATQSPVSATVE